MDGIVVEIPKRYQGTDIDECRDVEQQVDDV